MDFWGLGPDLNSMAFIAQFFFIAKQELIEWNRKTGGCYLVVEG